MPGYLLGFLFVGLAGTMAGPGLSHLRDRVGTDDGGIALVFATQAAGYTIGSLVAARGLDAGRGHVRWVVAMVVATASVATIGTLDTLAPMALAFAVLGFCAGICDASGNVLVAWSRPSGAGPALNALHMMFAVGTMLSPIVVDRSLAITDSVWGVAVPLSFIGLASSVVLLRRPSPARTRFETVARSVASGARHIHVGLVCAFFLVYVGLEMTFASWIHSYVEQVGYGGAATATGVTVMFGAGFTLGRLVAIPVARRESPGRILAVTSAMAVATSATFVLFDGPGAALWVISFAFAVSVAPQYASMMAFAESHLALGGRDASAFVASSGVGLLVMPWLTGQLFDHTGPEALPWTVFVLAVVAAAVLAVVATALRSLTPGTDQRPPATSSIEPVT